MREKFADKINEKYYLIPFLFENFADALIFLPHCDTRFRVRDSCNKQPIQFGSDCAQSSSITGKNFQRDNIVNGDDAFLYGSCLNNILTQLSKMSFIYKLLSLFLG